MARAKKTAEDIILQSWEGSREKDQGNFLATLTDQEFIGYATAMSYATDGNKLFDVDCKGVEAVYNLIKSMVNDGRV